MTGPTVSDLTWELVDDAPLIAPEPIPDPYLCGLCRDPKTWLVDRDGQPRRWLMLIDEGQAIFQCAEDEQCKGDPVDGMPEMLVTESAIPVTLTFDGPSPGHVHYDQIGCDCDCWLVVDADLR